MTNPKFSTGRIRFSAFTASKLLTVLLFLSFLIVPIGLQTSSVADEEDPDPCGSPIANLSFTNFGDPVYFITPATSDNGFNNPLASIDFPGGTQDATLDSTFEIRNMGQCSLDISINPYPGEGAGEDPPFSLDTNACSLAPSDFCLVKLTWTPDLANSLSSWALHVISSTDMNLTVLITLNSPGVMTTVPDLVGQTREAAETLITEAGLTVGTKTFLETDSLPDNDKVSSQTLAAGEPIVSGSAIDFEVYALPPQVSFRSPIMKGAVNPEVLIDREGPYLFLSDLDEDFRGALPPYDSAYSRLIIDTGTTALTVKRIYATADWDIHVEFEGTAVAGSVQITVKPTAFEGASVVSNQLSVPVVCDGMTVTCAIGDTGPGGGTVFYVAPTAESFESEAPECITGCNYLEVANAGWEDALSAWSDNYSDEMYPADYAPTAIGTGYRNSLEIIDQVDSGQSAAALARSFGGGNQNDWYLPSYDELWELFELPDISEMLPGLIPGGQYWSSTEFDEERAILWNSDDSTGYKNSSAYVRPIRAFASRPPRIAISVPSQGTARATAFTTQPVVELRNSQNLVVTGSNAQVNVAVSQGGSLIGTTTINAVNGVATYSGLGINGTVGQTYTITYSAAGYTSTTETITLTTRYCDGTLFVCQVGDAGPGGGIIFYVAPSSAGFQSAAPECTVNRCAYLEAPQVGWFPAEGDPSFAWASTDYVTTSVANAVATEIGSGYQNTLAIVTLEGAEGATFDTAAVAASAARAYSGGGLSDWYLPSKDELTQLYLQSSIFNYFDTNSSYWSSSQFDASNAWLQGFGVSNDPVSTSKGEAWPRVRPIRAFASGIYTITLAAGTNGSGGNRTFTKFSGVNLTLEDSTEANSYFTRAGYRVTGWSTTDGGTQTHALSGTFATNAATTLYPVWTQNAPPAPTPEPAIYKYPDQTSSITSIAQSCLANAKTVVINGTFKATIANIIINNQIIDKTLWKQTATQVVITVNSAGANALTIQIFNGEVPLLPVQSIVIAAICPTPTPTPTPTLTPTPTPTPTPKPTTNPQPSTQMVKVGTVYMASGKYSLNDETKRNLIVVAKKINASGAKTILVYGHADNRGGVDNTLLSQNRAKAVAAYLRPLLTVKKISIGWYSSKKPAKTGTSAADLALNRRVEIYTK